MEYWIWLQSALGAGGRADDIISYFSSPKDFYEAGRREWILSGVVSRDMAGKLERLALEKSFKVIEECRRKNWHIINPESEYYPPLLRDISSYPLVLYVWGDKNVLTSKVPIAFVGTRTASRYGLNVSQSLSYEVARAGALVVSGGALGIDSSSHQGALNAGGKTLALLGCGLGYPYLMQNEILRRDIAANGAVVSEFLPGMAPSKSSFPIRNRLISGISLGTVIIEAGERSGSLITAGFASRQGRDVFAVPGDIITSNYTGANKLIRDGAKPVFAPCDILNEYAHLYPDVIKLPEQKGEAANLLGRADKNFFEISHNNKKNTNIYNDNASVPTPVFIKQELPKDSGEELRLVYSLLSEEAKTADSLAEEGGVSIMDVLSALTELEMGGYAGQNEGGLFAALPCEKNLNT